MKKPFLLSTLLLTMVSTNVFGMQNKDELFKKHPERHTTIRKLIEQVVNKHNATSDIKININFNDEQDDILYIPENTLTLSIEKLWGFLICMLNLKSYSVIKNGDVFNIAKINNNELIPLNKLPDHPDDPDGLLQ